MHRIPKQKCINGKQRINKAMASQMAERHPGTINRWVKSGRISPPKYDKSSGEAWYEKSDIETAIVIELCDTYEETNTTLAGA
jgi:predicted site-specific integrase-resolvase